MSTVEDVWRRKTDFELEAAAARLGEYTDEAQRVILAELHRRRSEIGTSADVTSAGSPANEVLAPSDRIKKGWMWIAFGTIITVGTYIVGSRIGSGYIIAWGPIAYGCARSGAARWRRPVTTRAATDQFASSQRSQMLVL
jgi:hypothetical protein